MRKINWSRMVNPVYKKELKTSVRSMRVALTIMGYNAILALIGLLTYYGNIQMNSGYGFDSTDILGLYQIIVMIEFGLILFVIPAYTSSAVSGERERQTLEILLTSKLTPGQIIRGKLVSSISMLILLVVSSLPVLALVFSIGGVGVLDLLQLLLIAVVTAVYIGSFGLFFSAFFKRTTASTIFSYGFLIALVLGTIFVIGIVYLLLDRWEYSQYMQGLGNGYNSVDLRMFTCILMLNPTMSFWSMMSGQIGGSGEFTDFLHQFGTLPSVIENNWFIISLILQLAIGILMMLWAGRLLNPLKRRVRVRKKR